MDRDPAILSRRAFFGALGGAGALMLTGCSNDDPPTFGNLLRMGDNFTYRAQRLLFPRPALVRQFDLADITSFPAIGTINPGDPKSRHYSPRFGEAYDRLRHMGFADFRLEIIGEVARPGRYSLAQLKALGMQTQITRQSCEEGWTAIAQWTGTPLAALLHACGMLPTARYLNFRGFDDVTESLDLYDALHPQTMLAYGMNGRDLPIANGAPLRLKVETQLGYKSIKYLRRIEVVSRFSDFHRIKAGWSWSAGI